MTGKTETPPTGTTPTPHADNPLTTLAALAGEWAEAAGAAAVGVLEAEIGAMTAVMKPHAPLDAAEKAAEARKDEAETEAGFDNLPV